jgi:hypothetical protein
MYRVLSALILIAVTALAAANFRLYLKDGSHHIVREYKVEGDRVQFYSTERSEWEEIPVSLVDLKRTEAERREHEQQLKQEAAEIAAEDKFERAQREEREKIPVNPGVYLVEGDDIREIKVAESKLVSNRRRSVLKVLAPIPIVSGKATVELDGEHSQTLVPGTRPEFYIRLAAEERFGLIRLAPKKGARIVQKWTIVPVTNEIIEEQEDIELFRKQIGDGLYKIWPMQPLKPGEYAVVEYTQGKGNVQTWDFSIPASK